MWPNTILTKLLNINYPIIQAPMAGGATTPELVAAVSNAGGLGSLGAGYMKPDDIKATIKKIRALTHKPFAVNLFIPAAATATTAEITLMQTTIEKLAADFITQLEPITPPYIPSFAEQMEIIIAEEIPVFSFTFGRLDKAWIKQLKQNKTLIIGTATNLLEAQQLEADGIDLIAAQGSEAGGHRGTFIGKAEDSLIGTMALIPQLVDQIEIPIIAAGGIMDGRGIVAALTLGAAGVQMGTVFLTCRESGISESYKNILLNTNHDDTVLTNVFSGKLARILNNKFIIEMDNYSNDILDYPIQHALTAQMRKAANKLNLTDYMAMWAGQAAYLCKEMEADQLIKTIEQEVAALIIQINSSS